MGKYRKLAEDIVENVGGRDNISSVTHCITRLRFHLKDESIAKDDVLKNMEGVVTVMHSAGQYQVVIGNHVPFVYEDVCQVCGIGNEPKEAAKEEAPKGVFNKLIDIISGCFQPILGPLCASGIIRGLNALLVFILGTSYSASGTYAILNAIGERFPDMYIETTAGGGSRFDAGMLSVSSSMSPSCITDPIERARITANAAMMYPLSAISTVVSPSPNAATRRIIDRDTRFNIALFGVLSYSMDATAFSRTEMEAFRAQIEFYKANRLLIENGIFRVDEDGNRTIWTVSNEDRSEIIMLYLQHFVRPNTTAEKLFVPEANENYDYRVFARSHAVSEKESYTYPQENECYLISGDALKWAGISLVEQVSGIGYHEGMRFLGDFSSRLYIIRRI